MYKTAFSRLLLVLLFIVFFLLPESVCLAIGFQDIQRIINDNRTLLKNIDVEIVQYRNDDIEPIYREKWTIFSDKFRNEWQLDLTEPDNTGSKHTHELHTSNGQVEAHAYFHEKRGFVHTATPQSEYSPVMCPWRLFGSTGAGLDDPVLWLEGEITSIRESSDGLVRVEIPGKNVLLRIGNSSVEYQPYAKRIVTLDMNRGGVILSVEDRDKADAILQRFECSDINCSPKGAWYPCKTIFKKYIGNQLVTYTTRKVINLSHVSEVEVEKSFYIMFPNDFVVNDNISNISDLGGIMAEAEKIATDFLIELDHYDLLTKSPSYTSEEISSNIRGDNERLQEKSEASSEVTSERDKPSEVEHINAMVKNGWTSSTRILVLLFAFLVFAFLVFAYLVVISRRRTKSEKSKFV